MLTKPYIEPPLKLPLFFRIVAWFTEKKTKKQMLVPRILSWYPKAAISSGIFESLITHKDKQISARLLQMIRLQVSITIGCPFCIDMNQSNCEKNGITEHELDAMQNGDFAEVNSFSQREIIALNLVLAMTRTPVQIIDSEMLVAKEQFSEREIVIITTTIAQVNYWARLIKGLGVPVACPLNLLG